MSDAQATFDQVCTHARQLQTLSSIQALLEWDQQTQMPAKAAEFRAEQVSMLAGEIHKRATDERFGEQLEELQGSDLAKDPHSPDGATIRELKAAFDKNRKLPMKLVQQIASAAAIGQQVWVEARKNNDWDLFLPKLTEMVGLKREEAQATAENGCLYDALLDDYEPGAKTEQVAKALGAFKDELVPLIQQIAGSTTKVDSGLLRRHYPADLQRTLSERVTTMIGFDYEAGRLDTAPHPFCTELGPLDCRITTRFIEDNFNSAFFGSLHEAGHGLYEQGLRTEYYGLPPGRYCSLGLHESQSRLWENLVGRSLGFWDHMYADVQKSFSSLTDVSQNEFFAAINEVKPSLIRVEADEATYNLHIIIRFELEQDLIGGALSAADARDAWNKKYEEYLGITPDSDSDGVLQDIHWSAGLFGYFSTYSIGNIYGSQLLDAAESEIGSTHEMFARGEFQPLLEWLRENVHRAGFCRRPDALIQSITGSSIDHRPIMNHLSNKMSQIYQL